MIFFHLNVNKIGIVVEKIFSEKIMNLRTSFFYSIWVFPGSEGYPLDLELFLPLPTEFRHQS